MIRIFFAAGVALVLSVAATGYLIKWFTRMGIGQPIHEDVVSHTTKAGTPTMGGIAIVAAAVISYVLSVWYRGIYTTRGALVVTAIACAGVVGFLDDWISIRNERNLGLSKGAKTLGLGVVSLGFALAITQFTGQHHVISFTRYDNFSWLEIGRWGWVLWAVVVIYAFSNAVNLTDGLDGLAAGSGIFAYSAYVVIGFWTFRNAGLYGLEVDLVGLDLAVVASAMVGACAGFLWFNAAPAKIFMGDTGSLAIGTGLACLALTTNTVLLLPIIGALFVAETMSVVIQVISYRKFNRRVFLMAPVHHHFEQLGWPETRVIIRLWMLSAACTAAGIGLFYRDFLSLTEVLR